MMRGLLILFVTVAVFLLASLLFVLADMAGGDSVDTHGVITDRDYVAPTYYDDAYYPEEWNVTLATPYGDVVRDDFELYNEYAVGDTIDIAVIKGWITGIHY